MGDFKDLNQEGKIHLLPNIFLYVPNRKRYRKDKKHDIYDFDKLGKKEILDFQTIKIIMIMQVLSLK